MNTEGIEISPAIRYRHETGLPSWLIPIRFGLLNGKINAVWGPFEISVPTVEDANNLFESTLARVLSKAPMKKKNHKNR